MTSSSLVREMLVTCPVPLERPAAERFVSDLSGRGAALEAMAPSELALAAACVAGSGAAMRLLEQRYFGAIDGALRTMGDAAFVEEVKQLLRLRLYAPMPGKASALHSFLGRGSLQGFLRVAAVRIALDLRRQHRHEVLGTDGLPGAKAADLSAHEPELQHLRGRHESDFRRAFDDALQSLEPCERTVLRLYFVDRLNIDALAVVLQLPRSTAARRLAQVREQVVQRTRQRLRDALALSTVELGSLLGALEDGVDISLASALRRADA